MLRSLRTVVLAASVCAAALALPAVALAKDEGTAGTTAIAASSDAAARAELATQKVKRPRRASAQRMRRVAAVAAPPAYHSQCFLFFCSGGGRSFNWLVLGVAY